MNDWQHHIGVGTRLNGLGSTGPTRQRVVIAEEGPRKGQVAAIQTDHASGRVDAEVFVNTQHATMSMSGREAS